MTRRERSEQLQERLQIFALDIIRLVGLLQLKPEHKHLAYQVLRSSSSIGANYSEAQHAESKSDFIHKIAISRKESIETQYWLSLLVNVFEEERLELGRLLKESEEINKIISAIFWKAKS